MMIKDVMNKNIISIDLNTTPIKAFEKMYKNGVRRLFVLDENKNPQGVVSYSDLIGAFNSLDTNLTKENPKNTKELEISEIMSPNIMTIEGKENINDAANLMLRADVSGLLVLDNKVPTGVITKTDICRLVAANFLVEK
ncbi:MAG: CBS domain-containing protein [Methanobrevibacter sp.]|nr:CBS domain-containing protein [Candidatus Methanoflexus mossambicus]